MFIIFKGVTKIEHALHHCVFLKALLQTTIKPEKMKRFVRWKIWGYRLLIEGSKDPKNFCL